MANDTNVVTLVARLTRDPELRNLPSGVNVCELRVAFNTSQKDASGTFTDVGNFVNVTVWGNQGETIARLLSKGARVAISGRLSHRQYVDKDNNNREAHSIIAHSVQFLDPKNDSAPAPQSTPAATPPAGPPAPSDDDIPFAPSVI